MHIFRPWPNHLWSLKAIGLKLQEELRSRKPTDYKGFRQKLTKLTKQKKLKKKKKSEIYVQTICKSSDPDLIICDISKLLA